MVRIYFGCCKKTYFFGEVSALTIGKLIRMFGGKTDSVPKKVAESGFPKGVLVCKNMSQIEFNILPVFVVNVVL